MTPDEYLEIIDCVQLDGGYFIRPRCDAYTETLSMGIYYDRFCSSYAGNEVNIANFDLGIDQSYFQEFGENAGCLDCSESVSSLEEEKSIVIVVFSVLYFLSFLLAISNFSHHIFNMCYYLE